MERLVLFIEFLHQVRDIVVIIGFFTGRCILLHAIHGLVLFS